jgi:hypothetical protein
MAASVIKNAEVLLVNTATNAGTVTMPLTSEVSYRLLTIKDVTGTFSQRNLTISTQGSDTFEDGSTTLVINTPAAFLTFYAVSSSSKWVLVGGTNQYSQFISSLTVNTINNQAYVPVSPVGLVSTGLLASSLQSTIRGLGTIGYLSSASATVDPTNLVSTGLLASSLQSTVQGLGTIGYLSSASATVDPTNLVSTGLLASSLQSTIVGLGTFRYISTASLVSTTEGLVDHTELRSTVIGLTANLGTSGYLSTPPLRLSTSAFFTSSILTSTISTTNIIFTNALVARSTNLSSVFISNLTATQGYISAITTDSITIGDGNGWFDVGALRAVVVSSIQENTGNMYATTAYIGNTSTLNQIRFWGLIGNYNNTILAEVSTGTAVGAQEFLVFKGSSASDRIRFQTTGDIRFEPQVAAREFSTATALATPTMILQSNLVGLNTTSPRSLLDVRGTAFATTLSTQQFFLSSINGTIYTPVSPNNLVSTAFLDTSLRSTVANLGQIYLSTATAVSFSNLVSTPFLDTTLRSTTGSLQSNIEAWSQYPTTTNVTFTTGTSIRTADPNNPVQITTNNLNILGVNGGFGEITMGRFLNMTTSTSSEYYSAGFSPIVTGTISSFLISRDDGIATTPASLYISSLYFGNFGGTTSGQLTTDATATDLFWKGSKLNNQTGGGGGGGGAIDYVSAFTVSTSELNVSTVSSYAIFSYGTIATAVFNPGPDPMYINSANDIYIAAYSNLALNPTNDIILSTTTSTIVDTNAFFITSSNDSYIKGNLTLNNLMCYSTISTYTLAVYGSNTLVVDGTSIFKSNVTIDAEMTSRKKFVYSTLGVDDMYVQATDIDKTFLLVASYHQNIQLPSAATCGNGWNVQINNQPTSFGTLTILYDGSNTLVPTQYQGATVTCITDGSTWYAY